MRIYREGNKVFFIEDSSFTGRDYPHTIVSCKFDNASGKIWFVNSQTDTALRDYSGRSILHHFSDIKDKNGTAYGSTLEDVAVALASITNFNVGGGAANWDDIADKPPFFPPETHTHSLEDVTGLESALQTNIDDAKSYADSLVIGLIDDRGNYNASSNTFPTTGGSGTSGAILKGDLWVINVAGTLGGVAVELGDTIRALVDNPGQTASNWALIERNLGYTPENSANKATNFTVTNNITFPTTQAVIDLLNDHTEMDFRFQNNTTTTALTGTVARFLVATGIIASDVSSGISVTSTGANAGIFTHTDAETKDLVIQGSVNITSASGGGNRQVDVMVVRVSDNSIRGRMTINTPGANTPVNVAIIAHFQNVAQNESFYLAGSTTSNGSYTLQDANIFVSAQ